MYTIPFEPSPRQRLIIIWLGFAIWISATVAGGQPATLELVTEVPPTAGIQVDFIDAIQGLDTNPNEILFGTRNQGHSVEVEPLLLFGK